MRTAVVITGILLAGCGNAGIRAVTRTSCAKQASASVDDLPSWVNKAMLLDDKPAQVSVQSGNKIAALDIVMLDMPREAKSGQLTAQILNGKAGTRINANDVVRFLCDTLQNNGAKLILSTKTMLRDGQLGSTTVSPDINSSVAYLWELRANRLKDNAWRLDYSAQGRLKECDGTSWSLKGEEDMIPGVYYCKAAHPQSSDRAVVFLVQLAEIEGD